MPGAGIMVNFTAVEPPFNPISDSLLATPISGRGLFRTPLEILGSYRSIF